MIKTNDLVAVIERRDEYKIKKLKSQLGTALRLVYTYEREQIGYIKRKTQPFISIYVMFLIHFIICVFMPPTIILLRVIILLYTI